LKLVYIFYYLQKLHRKFLKFHQHNKYKQKSISRLLKNQNLKKKPAEKTKTKNRAFIIEKPINDKIFEILRAIKIALLLFLMKLPTQEAKPVKITKYSK
jgi:hypothetical protein